MSRKSILIVSTEYPPAPGGIGSHAYYLAKELKKKSWTVVIASEQNYESNEKINAFNRQLGYPLYRLLPTPSILLAVKKLMLLFIIVLRNRPSIVMGTGKHGSWFAYIVARLTFRKCALIGHGTEFTVRMSARSKKINNYVYSNCNMLICVSEYTRQMALKEGILNPKTFVIHNGADGDSFKRLDSESVKAFKKENRLEGKKIILTIGQVSNRKGQEWVIRALPEVIKIIPDAHYYCGGLPNKKEAMQKIAMEMNVADRVHFLEKVNTDDLIFWMSSCDVFAMTSVHADGDFEGFGIAVIEAALCGKPAVVTNQSGLAEAIIEGKTGFGVPEKNPFEIADRLIKLLNNEMLRTKMGLAAFENAQTNLTWNKIAEKYEAVFLKDQ